MMQEGPGNSSAWKRILADELDGEGLGQNGKRMLLVQTLGKGEATSKRPYLLRASSEAEASAWILALQSAMCYVSCLGLPLAPLELHRVSRSVSLPVFLSPSLSLSLAFALAH